MARVRLINLLGHRREGNGGERRAHPSACPGQVWQPSPRDLRCVHHSRSERWHLWADPVKHHRLTVRDTGGNPQATSLPQVSWTPPPCSGAHTRGLGSGEQVHVSLRHSLIPRSEPPQTQLSRTGLLLLNTPGKAGAFQISFSHLPQAPKFYPKHLHMDKKKFCWQPCFLLERKAGCSINTKSPRVTAHKGCPVPK